MPIFTSFSPLFRYFPFVFAHIFTDGKLSAEIEQARRSVYGSFSARSNDTEADVEKRVQTDPELQEILSDPVMRSILEQARTDPRALNEHMKNPTIRNKIMKLMSAGVIR